MEKPQDVLKKAREKSGYTQEVIAKEIGISSRMYQRYESGNFPKFKGEAIEKLDKLLGTKLVAMLYDNKVRANGYDQGASRILTGAHVTLQDHIDKIDQYNRFLQRIIESGLIEIKTNLTDIVNDLDAIETRQRADDTVMMKALDRLGKNEPGTLSKEADTLVNASSMAAEQDGNSLNESKKSTKSLKKHKQ